MRGVALAIMLFAMSPCPLLAAGGDKEKTIIADFFGVTTSFSNRVSQIFDRSYGRLLGSMVREGMTRDEVIMIFSAHESPNDYFNLSRRFGIEWRLSYYRLGVQISLDWNETVPRVKDFWFIPLID